VRFAPAVVVSECVFFRAGLPYFLYFYFLSCLSSMMPLLWIVFVCAAFGEGILGRRFKSASNFYEK
jgi:small-conductance mechanosensitive channel